MTTHSDLSTIVDLTTLSPGALIDVETKSRHYHIECLGGTAIRISGHPEYCPEPVRADLQGAIGKDGLEPGLIESGLRLLLLFNGKQPVTTSKVVCVHVDQPAGRPLVKPPAKFH
jgi:hypothetical protein